MTDFEDLSFDPDQFSGTVRIFPLPNLVMFPHVMQPLHVFEQRYRDLTEAALADDRLIALGVLAPGWESDYEGRPPLHSAACLGRIAAHQRLDGGRHNLLLLGQRRIRITGELPGAESYRRAHVELIDDIYPAATAPQRPRLKRSLTEAFSHLLPSSGETRQQLEQFLHGDTSLGVLTDVVAFALDLPIDVKVRLLAEANVDTRAALLAEKVAAAGPLAPDASARSFPPDFSAN